MKLPTSFKSTTCGPHTLVIKTKPLDNIAGEYSFQDLQIRINSSLLTSAQQETLFHEMVEAANHIYELNLSHNKIQILGAAMLQMVKALR